MTPEQLTTLLVAFTGLIGAFAALLIQVNQLSAKIDRNHDLVNGQMSHLVTLAQLAAHKTGELEGRDFIQQKPGPASG